MGLAWTGRLAAAVLVLGSLALPGSAYPQSPADSAAEQEEARQSVEGSGEAASRRDVVKVGALVNDIQQLDLQAHSYNVDMYLWFKWRNPDIDPSRSFEFMNAFELWGHILTYATDKPERLPDGTYYQVLRNQGKFNTKLPLERYPFDQQHLLVELEDSSVDESSQVFVPDEDPPVKLSRDMTLPGWDIEDPELEVVSNRYDTDFGNPSAESAPYSRVIIDVPVVRPTGTYALKLLLPMLLVALTALLALMVHPRYVEGRIGIGITALLTLVALQLTNNSSLPEVDYLMLLDKLYLVSYGFVVLTLAMIVRNSWVEARAEVAAASASRRSLAILTALYLLVVGLVLLESLV